MNSRYAFLVLFSLLRINMAWGQCADPSFSLLAMACIDQTIKIENTTPGFNEYKWDFCSGDFELTPNSTISVSNTLLFRTRSIRVAKSNDAWFGFTIDQANSPYRLIRFNFGTSLVNTPSVTNLGNPSNLLNGAYDFQLYNEGMNWYALVANSGGNNILRYNFGANLESTPTVQDLGSLGELLTPNGIFLINDNGSLYAFVSNGGVSKITRLDFGASINNTPTASSFSVASGSTLRGISITRECDRWFGLVTSYSNAKVFWFDFDNGLNQPPQSGEISFFTSYNFPASVSIAIDGGEYYAMIQSAVGPLYRLSFGSSIIDKTGVGLNLGNFGVSENFACEWAKDNSDWIGFSIDLGNRRLIRYTLPTVCDISPSIYNGQTPPSLSFSSSGAKKVTLVTNNSSGLSSTVSKSLVISSSVSPDINFSSQNICSNSDVILASQNSSNNISTYEWNFGDLNTSNSPSPTYQYTTAGEYVVSLNVTADNGCQNFTEKIIKIYDPPASSFTLPPGLICTNNEFTFFNTTVDNFDGNLTYQWLIDDVPTSIERDLLHTFVTGGDKEITLQTAIPGCSSEMIQLLPGVGEGPIVDFAVEGVCLNETIQMTNASSGDIASYAWDFGDGQTSTETNPVIDYTGIGEYSISLEALGNNGCLSTKTLNHQVFSVPQPNFNTDLPPFSCSGSPTQFNDLTPVLIDSNLESWTWMFGDNGATGSGQSPQHTYALSGLYDVTLQVTSDQGCTNQFTKSVSIAESPVATINNSPACVNTGTELQSASMTPIVDWEWKVENNFYYIENPSHVFASPGTYNVNLLVTGENGCLGSSFKQVIVPIPATIDFTSVKKCVGTDAEFHATATDSPDLAASYSWLMDGAEKQGENVSYVFPATGLYEVLLSVTTESGCVYTINKAQTVIENPQANFSYSPASGAPPLPVQFTNSSTNANSYNWHFNDATDATSSLASPSFTFTEVGDYAVDLFAYNEEGCESTISKLIKVAFPLLFVSLENFETIEGSNGILQMQVTLNNQGNVDVQDLPLSVQLNNGTELFEKVPELIPGGESRTLVLSTSLSKTPGLQFLCLSLQLENNAPGANEEFCLSLEESTIFTTPYPNPAKDILKLEWIADRVEDMNLSVVNSLGKEMLSISFAGQQGLNSHSLSTQLWQEGLYFVKVQSPSVERTFRIIIVR